jgi:hypothetical protein
MNLFFRICGRFFDESWEQPRVFGGVLLVKSWWMCGELWSVERLFSRGENLPHFSTLFCRSMAGGARGRPELHSLSGAEW